MIDPLHKAIVDQWMAKPDTPIVTIITDNIKEAKPHPGSCARRFNAIMRREEVIEYRDQQILMLQKQIDIDQTDATKFLAQTLNTNIADFLNYNDAKGVSVKNLTELPRELTAQIKKIKVSTTSHTGKNGSETVNTRTEFELYDKFGAIDRLAQLLKWIESNDKNSTLIGVIVLPEGVSKEEQWKQYQQLPGGGELIPAPKK